jgi:hypothetical protein
MAGALTEQEESYVAMTGEPWEEDDDGGGMGQIFGPFSLLLSWSGEISGSSQPFILKGESRRKSGDPRVSTVGVKAPTTHGN